MQNKDLIYDLERYTMIGRMHALNNIESKALKIFKRLQLVLQKEDILRILTCYLTGYKIGAVERSLKDIDLEMYFDEETRSWKEKKSQTKMPFEKEYFSLISYAEKEAKALLKIC